MNPASELNNMTTVTAPDASALTHATTQAAQWGAEIEELHQKSLTTGAESLRAMMDAGDRLQQAFESPDRKQHFPSFEDWVRQFAHIAPRTADNYRRLARQRDEVEAHIRQVLKEGQSPSLNGAIAYLKAEIERDDMPAWEEIERLLEPVGRVRASIGNRLIFEPKTWAERHVTGLPKVYPNALALWSDWKANSETWIEQVNAARDLELERQREAIAAKNDSQASDTEANEHTPVAPKSATATGQVQGTPATSVKWLDYADQIITRGSAVIYRLEEGNEIGIVQGFEGSDVHVCWPESGDCCHPPQSLLVCSDSQCVADEEPASPAIAQHCSGREYGLFEELPSKHYGLIYADPPWQYRDKAQAGQRGAAFKYDVLDVEALLQLPVASIAAEDCLLAMWWVPPMPMEALKLVEAWGFEFKTMKGFTWRKTTVTGLEHFGMGNYTRANTEDCLFAIKGRPERQSAAVRQLISAQVREHSRKPDEVRQGLVELMGDVPRIELFARDHAEGWDVWGNQAPDEITI